MKRLLLSCCVIVLLRTTAFPQSITATISGTAKDQTGAVLPGVEVTATNKSTAVTRSVITNERGEYVLPLLPIGLSGQRCDDAIPCGVPSRRESAKHCR